MKFKSVKTPPPADEVVLVRGWGEKKKHWIYSLARFTKTRTGYRWEEECGYEPDELFFNPIEWAELEQPRKGNRND